MAKLTHSDFKRTIKLMMISSSGVIHSIRHGNYVYFTEAVYGQPPVFMHQPVARHQNLYINGSSA